MWLVSPSVVPPLFQPLLQAHNSLSSRTSVNQHDADSLGSSPGILVLSFTTLWSFATSCKLVELDSHRHIRECAWDDDFSPAPVEAVVGQGFDEAVKGAELLDKINSDDKREVRLYYAKEALAHFNRIHDDDKKVIIAAKAFGKAICYYLQDNIYDARIELGNLNQIEITSFTFLGNTIRRFQAEGKMLWEQIEREIREYREEIERRKKIRKRNIIITAVIAAFIILGIVIYMFILNN